MNFTILGSGSGGNATVICNNGSSVLIDAGFDYKNILSKMKLCGIEPEVIKGIFITHEHNDHVMGLVSFLKSRSIPVFMNRGTYISMNGNIKSRIEPKTKIFETGSKIEIIGLTFKSFPVSHDAGEPVGYTVTGNEKKLSYVTDLGRVTPVITESLEGSDSIVVEANHDVDMLWDGSYPQFIKQRIAGPYGHLSNSETCRLLKTVMAKNLNSVYLAHLSQENNKPELALSIVRSTLEESFNRLPEIKTAEQDSPSDTTCI